MDVDSLVAIDVHTHVHRSVSAPSAGPGDNEQLAAMAAYFKTTAAAFTTDDLAAYDRERNMAAVTFTIDVRDQPDDPARATPEEIAERARDHADVLIPFGSVDPARGAGAIAMARRHIEEYGVRGFKFHPSAQGFFPTHRAAYPLYEVIEAAGLPAPFHTGQTGAGAGTWGGGIRLAYSNPMYLDDVAVEDVRRFEAEFSHYLDNNKADLLTAIREEKQISDKTKTDLKAALTDFKGRFQSGAKKA